MAKFLIDANLPFNVREWSGEEYLHVRNLDERLSDSQIWEYARKNFLSIVTQDSDFSHRMIISEPPPKVIHIRLGNMRLKDFKNFVELNWPEILRLNQDHKLVNVYLDKKLAIA